LMLCYGPPTPPILKGLFVGPLRSVVQPLTTRLANLLLRFDEHQDRNTDTFIFFKCVGTKRAGAALPETHSQPSFICPRCSSELVGVACVACGTRFPEADGMLFLLPAQFAQVYEDYVHGRRASLPAAHL